MDRKQIVALVKKEKIRRIQMGKVSYLQQLIDSINSHDYIQTPKLLKNMSGDQINEVEPVLKCSLLHIASYCNNSKAITQLLKFDNIEVNAKTKKGWTAFELAVQLCCSKTIETLVGDTRVEIGSLENIECIIGKKNEKNTTEQKKEETRELIINCIEKRETLKKLKYKREQKKKVNEQKGTNYVESGAQGESNKNVDELLAFIEGPSKSANKVKKQKQKHKNKNTLPVLDIMDSPQIPMGQSNEKTEKYDLVERKIHIHNTICDNSIPSNPVKSINERTESNEIEKESISKPNKWIKIGKLSFCNQYIIGSGSQGTIIFSGEFDGRKVAIKRLLKSRLEEADKERALLRQADDHENIVRYFSWESDESFVYLALELCLGSLKDLIEAKIDVKMDALTISSQALSGLEHLHGLVPPIIHRDIKPSNILILVPNNKDHPRVVIADLGCSKQLDVSQTSFSSSGSGDSLHGTLGWIAPEVLKSIGDHSKRPRRTNKMDIFSMGLVTYYTLTKGYHPFGDPLRRDGNIIDNKFNLKYLDNKKDCLSLSLIETMIAHDPVKRPSASASLNHPTFWSTSTTKEFLLIVSDLLELKDKRQLIVIEKGKEQILNPSTRSWIDALDKKVKDYLTSSLHRTYDEYKIKDLLRAIRNMAHHYQQLESAVKLAVGSLEDGFVNYWISRFPKLVIHTYSAMVEWKSWDDLSKFYHFQA